MAKLLVSEFVSLDGVYESPGWTMEFGFDPRMGVAMGALMGPDSSDIVLGRDTHAMFAPAWSTRSAEDDPGAPFMNDTPKHVVTSRQLEAEWQNSTAIGYGDVAGVRERATGNVFVTGSGTLVRALLDDELVDGLHLFVYPVVRGTGERLFGTDAQTRRLALAECETYDNGVVHLHYAPA